MDQKQKKVRDIRRVFSVSMAYLFLVVNQRKGQDNNKSNNHGEVTKRCNYAMVGVERKTESNR